MNFVLTKVLYSDMPTVLCGGCCMAGMRVYELARDLGISSKNLIEELRNQGIDVKSHMSTMDEETAGLVLDLYRPHATIIATNPPPTESPTMLSSTFTPPTPP